MYLCVTFAGNFLAELEERLDTLNCIIDGMDDSITLKATVEILANYGTVQSGASLQENSANIKNLSLLFSQVFRQCQITGDKDGLRMWYNMFEEMKVYHPTLNVVASKISVRAPVRSE